jgi:hypothetical protein
MPLRRDGRGGGRRGLPHHAEGAAAAGFWERSEQAADLPRRKRGVSFCRFAEPAPAATAASERWVCFARTALRPEDLLRQKCWGSQVWLCSAKTRNRSAGVPPALACSLHEDAGETPALRPEAVALFRQIAAGAPRSARGEAQCSGAPDPQRSGTISAEGEIADAAMFFDAAMFDAATGTDLAAQRHGGFQHGLHSFLHLTCAGSPTYIIIGLFRSSGNLATESGHAEIVVCLQWWGDRSETGAAAGAVSPKCTYGA